LTQKNKTIKKEPNLITDRDVMFVNGNKDDLLGRFQMQLSKVKEKIRKLFERNK
jgi:uncharacterized protein YjbJ (UPF0337 family)